MVSKDVAKAAFYIDNQGPFNIWTLVEFSRLCVNVEVNLINFGKLAKLSKLRQTCNFGKLKVFGKTFGKLHFDKTQRPVFMRLQLESMKLTAF